MVGIHEWKRKEGKDFGGVRTWAAWNEDDITLQVQLKVKKVAEFNLMELEGQKLSIWLPESVTVEHDLIDYIGLVTEVIRREIKRVRG